MGYKLGQCVLLVDDGNRMNEVRPRRERREKERERRKRKKKEREEERKRDDAWREKERGDEFWLVAGVDTW